jgi:hypothetical protein
MMFCLYCCICIFQGIQRFGHLCLTKEGFFSSMRVCVAARRLALGRRFFSEDGGDANYKLKPQGLARATVIGNVGSDPKIMRYEVRTKKKEKKKSSASLSRSLYPQRMVVRLRNSPLLRRPCSKERMANLSLRLIGFWSLPKAPPLTPLRKPSRRGNQYSWRDRLTVFFFFFFFFFLFFFFFFLFLFFVFFSNIFFSLQ